MQTSQKGLLDTYFCSPPSIQTLKAAYAVESIIGKTFRIDAVPQVMAGCYIGICDLPVTLSEPIGIGARFTAGRNQKFLKKLRVLSGPGFVQSSQSNNCVCGDNMGVSRNAFMCEVAPNEGLMVTPVSSLPIFHLDDQMNLCGTIEPEHQRGFLIPSGHHLVVGHYVLRYGS